MSTANSTVFLPPTIQFQEIPIGQFFEFRGRRYKKLALSMAEDEDHYGNIFQAQTEVLPDSTPRNCPSTPPARPPASSHNTQPTA